MNKTIKIPYGRKDIWWKIPERNLVGIFEANEKPRVEDEFAEIERALDNPIGTRRFSDLKKVI